MKHRHRRPTRISSEPSPHALPADQPARAPRIVREDPYARALILAHLMAGGRVIIHEYRDGR